MNYSSVSYSAVLQTQLPFACINKQISNICHAYHWLHYTTATNITHMRQGTYWAEYTECIHNNLVTYTHQVVSWIILFCIPIRPLLCFNSLGFILILDNRSIVRVRYTVNIYLSGSQWQLFSVWILPCIDRYSVIDGQNDSCFVIIYSVSFIFLTM